MESVFLHFCIIIYDRSIKGTVWKRGVALNDKKIIEGIIRKDEQLFAIVIRKYSGLLWKIAASVLINAGSAQDVEECVADVFIYLWQNPEKYDSDKAKLSSWLSLVTRSRAVDRYRRIAGKKELPLEEAAVHSLGYAEAAEADEEQERLRFCMDRLEENEKELILRRYYYEQKPAEIAVALDLPKKQVENKLYYVRQKLRKMMENKEGDEAYGGI